MCLDHMPLIYPKLVFLKPTTWHLRQRLRHPPFSCSPPKKFDNEAYLFLKVVLKSVYISLLVNTAFSFQHITIFFSLHCCFISLIHLFLLFFNLSLLLSHNAIRNNRFQHSHIIQVLFCNTSSIRKWYYNIINPYRPILICCTQTMWIILNIHMRANRTWQDNIISDEMVENHSQISPILWHHSLIIFLASEYYSSS